MSLRKLASKLWPWCDDSYPCSLVTEWLCVYDIVGFCRRAHLLTGIDSQCCSKRHQTSATTDFQRQTSSLVCLSCYLEGNSRFIVISVGNPLATRFLPIPHTVRHSEHPLPAVHHLIPLSLHHDAPIALIHTSPLEYGSTASLEARSNMGRLLHSRNTLAPDASRLSNRLFGKLVATTKSILCLSRLMQGCKLSHTTDSP